METHLFNPEQLSFLQPSQLSQVPEVQADGDTAWKRTFRPPPSLQTASQQPGAPHMKPVVYCPTPMDNTGFHQPSSIIHGVDQIRQRLAMAAQLGFTDKKTPDFRQLQMTPAAHGDSIIAGVPHQTMSPSPPPQPPVFNLCSSGLQQQQQPSPPQQTFQQQQQQHQPTPPQQTFQQQQQQQQPSPPPQTFQQQQQQQHNMSITTPESTSSTGSLSKKGRGVSPFVEDEANDTVGSGGGSSSSVHPSASGSDVDTYSAFLRNFFLLAKDHDAQMSEKDDIIRQLMTEKAELEQTLLTVQSSLGLMQIEREAEEAKDRARKTERVREEAEACLRQALAHQEKKDWGVVTTVLRAMECICCYEARPKVKVFQCNAGHLICELCRKGLRDPVCPTCAKHYTVDIRNLLAEELAHSLNLNDY